MNHHASSRFWRCYDALPDRIRKLADKSYELLKADSRHPSLHLERVGLYIDLSEATSVESREISEGVVLDYDTLGNLVGIDIDNASRKVQLNRVVLNGLPAEIQTIAVS